ncbi:hypothetical protein HK104_011065 [Borealophlyctis nickersoniae]|nr:hypothetical protein HK104_011065 [Borealophlyctis nickersoniae]
MSRFPSPIALEILRLLHHVGGVESLSLPDVALALEAAVWHGRPDLCRYLIDEWLDMHYPSHHVGSLVSELLHNCVGAARQEDLPCFHAILETRAYKRAQWEREALHRVAEWGRFDYLDVLDPIRCSTLTLTIIQQGTMLGLRWADNVLVAVTVCAGAFATFVALIAIPFVVAFATFVALIAIPFVVTFAIGFELVLPILEVLVVIAYLMAQTGFGAVLLGALIVAINCMSMSLPGVLGITFGVASVIGRSSYRKGSDLHTSKILVKRLGTNMTVEKLAELVEQYGTIESIEMDPTISNVTYFDDYNRFAHIVFASRAAATRAQKAIDGVVVDGRTLICDKVSDRAYENIPRALSMIPVVYVNPHTLPNRRVIVKSSQKAKDVSIDLTGDENTAPAAEPSTVGLSRDSSPEPSRKRGRFDDDTDSVSSSAADNRTSGQESQGAGPEIKVQGR